ncbi:MAG: virulence factor SrfB, partial [Methylobacteriaceae bacterium]|nr:virulence factor SrfB [Methylobacteriaceae bacterium]
RRFKPENLPHAFEHTARYLTFLSLLQQACRFPKIRLVDTISAEKSYVPIRVDLVIDVGNSRTCGILIETDPDANDRLDLSKSYVLSLRDLSRPELVHSLPFESHVEFARPAFGSEAISRRSGRANAFYWPSLTRVGPEAVRLSVSGAGTEGATGLSSPKRYLWDRRPLNQVWRFRDVTGSTGPTQEPQVSGSVLAYLTEEGDVLRQLKRPATAAIRPKFSRSSLFTFLMTEVILQAIMAINSVESRSRQRNSDIPRELRQIIMTVPPATPLAERRIMRDRVEGATKLAWQALGWTGARHFTPAAEPKVDIAFDEATCTQIVYLYSEITQKLQRTAADFFAIMGKVRPSHGTQPTLRVASIDIGGGTTDLMVITYATQDRRAIVPTQLFREGFKVAGDDILEAVVFRHVLFGIEAHLVQCGLREARGFLRNIVGADRGGQSEQERQFRRRLVTQVAVPVALALLREYEAVKPFSEEAPRALTIGQVLGSAAEGSRAVIEEFDRLAAAAGASGFALTDATVQFSVDDMAETVQQVIGNVLSDLAEVIHAVDCDVVLISGRPSRFPVVLDLLLSRLPTRPDRIIPMNQYRVGKWYPFRDAFDRVDDPKTTVAVGALLCNLAESQLQGFVLSKNRLTITSTARYIGEMELSGILRNDALMFADIDLDGKPRDSEMARTVRVFPPTNIGFRQLQLERWPATPLYVIEFANPATAARLKLPLSVTIERAEADEGDESRREDFRITDVQDAEGTSLRHTDVVLRLQTLKSPSGYWLDTGVVESY